MVTVKFQGKEYPMKNELQEMNLKEYQRLSEIFSKEGDPVGNIFEAFELLGLPREIIDELDSDELFAIYGKLKHQEISREPVRTFEYDGYTYTAHQQLKAWQTRYCERATYEHPRDYVAHVMACIFLRDDLTETEHKAAAHIKHKAGIFSKHMTADVAAPYCGVIAQKLIKNVEGLAQG